MKTQLQKITFLNGADLLCIVLAKLGQSSKRIQSTTGLTAAQISYRLNKARRAERLSYTYRTGWRDGLSKEAAYVWHGVQAYITRETKRQLPPKVVKLLPHRGT